MPGFGPVDPQLDLVGLEHRVLSRWQAQDVLDQVAKLRAGGPRWVFYEGPPTANARPGLHHVWPRAFKDLFIRYQTMRGRDVPRKGGWDCHGLPVEIEVEKELGISNKHEIEAFGIAAFHELGQPGAYREVTDMSVYVRFPVQARDFDLLVWTTTPWTLISNVAAAVGPDIEYVRVRSEDGGRDLVMAAARAPEGAEVVERMRGADLVGMRYQRPFAILPIDDRGQRVVHADLVSTDERTRVVHLAPAFGADDMEAAQKEGLPVLNPVGPDGTFGADVPPWQGRFVKDADQDIIEDLRQRGV